MDVPLEPERMSNVNCNAAAAAYKTILKEFDPLTPHRDSTVQTETKTSNQTMEGTNQGTVIHAHETPRATETADQLSSLEARLDYFRTLTESCRDTDFRMVFAEFSKIIENFVTLRVLKRENLKDYLVSELAECTAKYSAFVQAYEIRSKLKEIQIARSMLDIKELELSMQSVIDYTDHGNIHHTLPGDEKRVGKQATKPRRVSNGSNNTSRSELHIAPAESGPVASQAGPQKRLPEKYQSSGKKRVRFSNDHTRQANRPLGQTAAPTDAPPPPESEVSKITDLAGPAVVSYPNNSQTTTREPGAVAHINMINPIQNPQTNFSVTVQPLPMEVVSPHPEGRVIDPQELQIPLPYSPLEPQIPPPYPHSSIQSQPPNPIQPSATVISLLPPSHLSHSVNPNQSQASVPPPLPCPQITVPPAALIPPLPSPIIKAQAACQPKLNNVSPLPVQINSHAAPLPYPPSTAQTLIPSLPSPVTNNQAPCRPKSFQYAPIPSQATPQVGNQPPLLNQQLQISQLIAQPLGFVPPYPMITTETIGHAPPQNNGPQEQPYQSPHNNDNLSRHVPTQTALADQTQPRNAQANGLDSFAYVHSLLELKKPSPDPFEGDFRVFNSWFSTLMKKMSRLQICAADAIEVLQAQTQGAPQELIKTLSSNFTATPEQQLDSIQLELKRRFGSSRHVAESLYMTLSELPTISEDAPDFYNQLRKFSDTCLLVSFQVDQCQDLCFLNTNWGLDPIRQKLPQYMIRDWRKIRKTYMENNRETHPPFNVFVDFLVKEANEVGNDAADMNNINHWNTSPRLGDKNQYSECMKQSIVSQKFSKSKYPASIAAENLECIAHPNGRHESISCNFLGNLQEQRLKRLIFQYKLCFKCLSSKHRKEHCTRKFKCKICLSENHPAMLHFWNRENENRRNIANNNFSQIEALAHNDEEQSALHERPHKFNEKNFVMQRKQQNHTPLDRAKPSRIFDSTKKDEKWMYCRRNGLCIRCLTNQHSGEPCPPVTTHPAQFSR